MFTRWLTRWFRVIGVIRIVRIRLFIVSFRVVRIFMSMFTVVAHGRTFAQRYLNVDDRNLDFHASTKMEIRQIRKRYLYIGDFGYVEIDNP